MIKHKEPNPLAVFNMRRLDFCPPHFETITFDLKTQEKVLLNWIYENTEGRFFCGQVLRGGPVPKADRGDEWRSANVTREMVHCIGFENHAEASFFAIQMNQINKSNYDF